MIYKDRKGKFFMKIEINKLIINSKSINSVLKHSGIDIIA